jgi:rhodanese-related sulfurtransferase
MSLHEVTVDELARLLSKGPAPVLLDVRQPEEFAIAALAGSRLLPVTELHAHLAELDPDAPTVVICHHGIRSLHVAHFLHAQGFTNVRSLKGGIDLWSRRIDPSLPRY